MPKVSVIIPAYNHAAYVRQCVDSVLAQTYQDLEIVVVDDGSTDGTFEILREYGTKIQLHRQENGGTQKARNKAVELASGDYIALLDSDDAWLPTKLQRQIPAFSSTPTPGVVYSLAYVIDSSGSVLPNRGRIGAPISNPERCLEELILQPRIPALTAVIRRSCLDEVGTFDESLVGAGDGDLWLRIAAKWPVVCIPEPLALYRVHQYNTTNELFRSGRVIAEATRALEKAFQRMPQNAATESLKRRAYARRRLLAVEACVMAGDAGAAGTELARVVGLDPSAVGSSGELAGWIRHWVELYGLPGAENQKHLRFFREMLLHLQGAPSSARELTCSALSVVAVNKALFHCRAGDIGSARRLALIGIRADPSC
jgi:glycosyltransferase involved in cell wall biosynthesis